MPASGSSGSLSITNGSDADSQTMLQIVRASDAVLEAHVLRGNREITDERPASAFNWTRSSGDAIADATWNNAHRSMKQITLTTAEINGNMQFSCAYTETEGSYGTVQVNDSLVASHTPATADANDVFTIENGMLKVTTSTANGTDYALNAGTLSVNNGFSGTLTSTATFNNDAQTREIDFIYDHNGMRTAKIVSENGRVEMTEYTLHGKLITHLTKRTVDENGAESTEELHFFYDAQSRPAFVEYDGAMYRYIHNLQSDIVAIVDTVGNPVVEYKYDAWGNQIYNSGELKDSLGKLNPIRYRSYIWDEEFELFYLKDRYYDSSCGRFISADCIVGYNLYSYSDNAPITKYDPSGKIAAAIPFVNSFIEQLLNELPKIIDGVLKIATIAAGAVVTARGIVSGLANPKSGMTNAEAIDYTVAVESLLLQNGIDEAVKKAVDPNNKYTMGQHWHHIVPKAHPLAEDARKILYEAGIDVWTAPQNQVQLSAQFHKFLHGEYYVLGINHVILSIKEYSDSRFPDNKEMLNANITLGLDIIGTALLAADQFVTSYFQ